MKLTWFSLITATVYSPWKANNVFFVAATSSFECGWQTYNATTNPNGTSCASNKCCSANGYCGTTNECEVLNLVSFRHFHFYVAFAFKCPHLALTAYVSPSLSL